MSNQSWQQRQAIKIRLQRKVEDLISVEASEPPSFTTGSKKLRGRPAQGLAYEGKVGKHLTKLVIGGQMEGNLWLGPWIRFEDANGPGMAQPDAILLQPDKVLIFESKLKQTKAAEPQIKLYGDLLERLLEVPWAGVCVFKYPSQKVDAMWIERPQELVSAEKYRYYQWHWLG